MSDVNFPACDLQLKLARMHVNVLHPSESLLHQEVVISLNVMSHRSANADLAQGLQKFRIFTTEAFFGTNEQIKNITRQNEHVPGLQVIPEQVQQNFIERIRNSLDVQVREEMNFHNLG